MLYRISAGRCLRCRPLRGLREVVAQKLVSNGLNRTTGIYLYCGLFRVVSVFNPDGGVVVEKGYFYSSERSTASCSLSMCIEYSYLNTSIRESAYIRKPMLEVLYVVVAALSRLWNRFVRWPGSFYWTDHPAGIRFQIQHRCPQRKDFCYLGFW